MIKNLLKKISSATLVLVLAFVGFASFEPETVSAVTDAITVNLTVDSGISITSPADVTMSNIGVTTNTSTGWAIWNVKTNDTDGYTLGVQASASPAMVSGGNSFTDYTEAVTGTPDTWSVDASTYQFGFSAIGSDVENVNTDEYAAAGVTTCDNGIASTTINTTLKWEGFTTSNEIIATDSTVTPTAGVDTRICFAAEQNGVYTPSGAYTATITATAVVL